MIESELQHADRLAPTRYGSEEPASAVFLDDHDSLLGQRGPFQRHALGALAPQRIARCAAGHVAEPDKRSTAEVGDEKAHVSGVERVGQRGGEHIGRRDRRRVLNRSEQHVQIKRRAPPISHDETVAWPHDGGVDRAARRGGSGDHRHDAARRRYARERGQQPGFGYW